MSTVTDTTVVQSSRDCHLLVRIRDFVPNDLLQVFMQLRCEKVTGTMTINFSQGGINLMRLREEQDIRYSEK